MTSQMLLELIKVQISCKWFLAIFSKTPLTFVLSWYNLLVVGTVKKPF